MIDIVCNIDDNFVKYCSVMLASLFTNNKKNKFHIHIITDRLSEESQKVLRNFIEEEYGNHLSIYSIDKEIKNKYLNIDMKGSHISIATFYRCFTASILPCNIKKALYLDCDIFVNGSIEELWEIDINEYAAGVVEDQWSNIKEYYSRLAYPESYCYFNAGVMLINLDYWRKHNIEEKIMEYISKYPERLVLNDQDVLNAVLYKEKLFIPYRWNMQDGFYRRRRKVRSTTIPELDKELNKGIIIHFTGSKKPWDKKSMHPLRKLYHKYIDLTPWKGERVNVGLILRINKILLIIQGYLGLKNAYRNIKIKDYGL